MICEILSNNPSTLNAVVASISAFMAGLRSPSAISIETAFFAAFNSASVTLHDRSAAATFETTYGNNGLKF